MEPHVFWNDVTFLFKFLCRKIEGSYFPIQADFLLLQHADRFIREIPVMRYLECENIVSTNSPIREIARFPSGRNFAANCHSCCIPCHTSKVTSTPAAFAFSANRSTLDKRSSYEPIWISSGGSPCRSAKEGDASGERVSTSLRFGDYPQVVKKKRLCSVVVK